MRPRNPWFFRGFCLLFFAFYLFMIGACRPYIAKCQGGGWEKGQAPFYSLFWPVTVPIIFGQRMFTKGGKCGR